MATTADIKKGLFIEFNNDIFTIVDFQHVKPGKGPAFVRTKLRNLKSGKVIDNTFSSGHKINTVRIERRPYQYLYNDESGFHFMHNETFEQLTIEASLIENTDLYKEGQAVEIMYHTETEMPMTCELPSHVVLEVTYSEPGVRGDTSSSTAMKPAKVETGATIMVPLFVDAGDKIKIDTRDKSYTERIK